MAVNMKTVPFSTADPFTDVSEIVASFINKDIALTRRQNHP
jgi:hypothetical protein